MQTITAAKATTAQPGAARRYGLILYFVAAYAWTWLFQLLSALLARPRWPPSTFPRKVTGWC